MELNPHQINKDGKLKHLLADDLFSEDIKQVFNAKTGKYIGYIKDGLQIIEEEGHEIQPPEEPQKNPDQLSLF